MWKPASRSCHFQSSRNIRRNLSYIRRNNHFLKPAVYWMFSLRALKLGYLTQDMIDDYEPALMFTIPRLAIVW